VVLADLWLVAGRPSEARRLCTQALAAAATHGAPVARAAAELHVALSELDVEIGDLGNARQHLDAAAALAHRVVTNESRYRWFVAKALLARADDDPEEAVQHLNQAEQLYRPGFYPEVRPIAAIKARTWIKQGKLSEAADWARAREVSTTDEARYLSEFDHLTLVRLVVARHRAEPSPGTLVQAVDLLNRLHEAAETSGRAGSLLDIRLLQALVQDGLDHRRQALEFLAQAVGLAPEPEGYLRLFVDEGAPMLGLLRDAADHGVAGDRARRLLALASVPAAVVPGPPQRQAALSAEPLSDRELQVLRLLDSELTGPQIARELFVSHNTVRTHTKHIFAKLDVTNRRAAVLRARERGLI
jgi:LuxR family maltose regulon positive regulatory protein